MNEKPSVSDSTRERTRLGITLIEIMMVVAIMGVIFAMAVPSLRNVREDQRVKAAVRGVADAFQLARAESIRTGDNHFVVLQGASGALPPAALQTTAPVAVVDDGLAATADCGITSAGEIRHTVPAENNIRWGTSLAGNNPVPTDSGLALANVAAGSSFTDATVTAQTTSTAKFASWVLFQPDGLPRLMTPSACANVGLPGQGGGAIYLTNGRRDYAVVLSPLGTVRVHSWNPAVGGWSQ